MATTDRQATTLALAHALSAAERGLAVIPLARTKLPALRSPHRDAPTPEPFTCHGECGRFGHGVHDASTDPARVRALFAAASWATGYGIACGLPPHHLIGIDLDTKSETDSSTALRELALRHLFTIPPTVVVLTPSGGRHLWLTGPPDHVVPNSAGRLAPGIDVRAPAATWSAPAPAPGTAPTRPPPARPTWLPHPARPPCCACCSRPLCGVPGAGRRVVTAGAWSSSSSPRTGASATPACSGRPAAPTRTASARTCWPPCWMPPGPPA
ncbi:hypothetical protein SVIOM342S_08087 [Streptomyces violaceorubidus]